MAITLTELISILERSYLSSSKASLTSWTLTAEDKLLMLAP